MSFIESKQITDALKARLEALPWDGGTKLFEAVKLYSSPNVLQALEDLRVFKNRACFIVPDEDDYQNERDGPQLHTELESHFILLLADRDFGRRQNAAEGSIKTPGVIEMNRLVRADLVGNNLGIRGCLVKPMHGVPILLQGKEREEASGREAWSLEIAVEAGETYVQFL